MMDRLQLFQNLVIMAASDGKFAEEEIQALAVRAENWNISNEDFESILIGVRAGEVDLQLPESRAGRYELLGEMIRLMAADGELAEVEKHLCATVAVKMDISNEEIDAIIREATS